MQRILLSSLPKNYFWDLNAEKLDDNLNKRIIIERVFSLGDIEDLKKIIEFYGLKTIKQEIVKAGQLDKKTLNWASKFLKIPKKNFLCYSKIQSNQVHWNF